MRVSVVSSDGCTWAADATFGPADPGAPDWPTIKLTNVTRDGKPAELSSDAELDLTAEAYRANSN